MVYIYILGYIMIYIIEYNWDIMGELDMPNEKEWLQPPANVAVDTENPPVIDMFPANMDFLYLCQFTEQYKKTYIAVAMD